MAAAWRDLGYGDDDFEIWSIGHPGSATILSYYVQDATSTCFEDVENQSYSAYALYEARQDDLVILGRDGAVRHHVSTIETDLRTEEPRGRVDGWIRALLAQ